MNDDLQRLVAHRMSRARGCVSDAKRLLADGSLNSAANRFYYGIFYASRAALATKDLDSSKHSGVIAVFNREFVKPGLLAQELSRIFSSAFELRQEGDYEDFRELRLDEVEQLAADAERFVQAVGSFVE